MKRKAILIGNTSGLQGVSVDLNRYKQFLTSANGGLWNDNEIEILSNPSSPTILKGILLNVKINEKPDFALVVFSGHGGYKRSTILEINEKHDTINESELWNLAKRQITILDCCRGVEQEELRKTMTESFSAGGRIMNSISLRSYYDDRMMLASEQQVKLYSCLIGESSIDTGRNGGGLYTKNLFMSIQKLISSDKYLTINDAHERATLYTSHEAKSSYNHEQNPDSTTIRCLHNKQLIIGMNPSIFFI